MHQKTLRWLVKEAGQEPVVTDYSVNYDDDNDRCSKELRLAQSLVGGYVEMYPVGPQVALLLNEDGISMNLPENCGFLGTIVFVGVKIDNDGEEIWYSLNEEQIRKCKAWAERRKDAKPDRSLPTIVSLDQETWLRSLENQARARLEEWESL
jgi:hypothetical protein